MKFNTLFSIQLDHDADPDLIEASIKAFLQLHGTNLSIRKYTSLNKGET